MSKKKEPIDVIEPEPCPFCGSGEWDEIGEEEQSAIYCLTCGAVGPYAVTTYNATRLWNLRA